LEAGRDPGPPPAPARNSSAREHRDGAPLWRLTDFADALAEDERAAVEAALQSAGVLDAWVFPDGTMQTDDDVVLGPAGPQLGASLAAVLEPSVGLEEAVGADAVLAVLGRIGWGESSGAALWVDHTGCWGSGPARGSWSKDRAEFVGAGARERHRREMIASLRTRAEELEADHDAAVGRVEQANRQAERVRDECASYPTHAERELATMHERAATAQHELDRALQAVEESGTAWKRAADAAEEAADELADQAARFDIGTTPAELDAVGNAVQSYAEALVETRAALRMAAAAVATRHEAEARAAEAAEAQERKEAEHRTVRTQAASLRSKYEALHATVGATVAELQSQLREITQKLADVRDELKQIGQEQLAAAAAHGRSQERVQDSKRRREETAAARQERIAELRAFGETGLLRVALPDFALPADTSEEWNVSAALSLSRNVEQQLNDVDESEDAWRRAQQRVSSASTDLSTQMSRKGHTAFVEQRGDVLVARVRYQNDEIDVDRLAVRLADDVAGRERLLSAREREILENHLVNEVAGHLHELLQTAEEQIDRMNRELAQRKTSTGMQLRVRWRESAQGPAGLAAARNLMSRSDATWTPEDRTAIGDFLQAQIAEVRQADPTGGWQEHLEQALDYRQWHSFVVERWQNGQWRSASGPASGGERALAVSVPLFAAASAHYNSAGPHAPRLILLDEAFAGVDDDSREKSLGLLATFDLDVVLTSEREWGCYPQVPGLAIAQLSRVEGVEAVGVTRWRWDGTRRQRAAEVDGAARAGGHPPDSTEDAHFG
jgi:uncharacterized protein (TIGR02680 family)